MRADIKELASIRSLWVIPICAILAHISSVSLISFFLDKVDQPADVPYEQLTASGLFMVMIGIYGTLASTGVLSRNSIALEMLVQPRRGTVQDTQSGPVDRRREDKPDGDERQRYEKMSVFSEKVLHDTPFISARRSPPRAYTL